MNLSTLLPRNALNGAGYDAFVLEDQRLTYNDLKARVNHLAKALLADGVGKRNKNIAVLANCFKLFDLYWAVAKTGAVVVPLSPFLKVEALGHLFMASESVMVFADETMAFVVEAVCDRVAALHRDSAVLVDGAPESGPPDAGLGGDDSFDIIFSSGTTGESKCIIQTYRIRAMYCMQFLAALRITPDSVVLYAGSLVFNGAFVMFLAAFYAGATFVLHGRFDSMAAIRLADGVVANEEELREWINANVRPAFQRVHKVVVLDELPRNIVGKTLKRLLRERYTGG